MSKMMAEPMTVSQLQVLSGRDRRTISTKLSNVEPVKVSGKSKFYSPPTALAAIFMSGDDGQPLDHTHESARLKKAQADKTELEVSVLRGDLIPANVVRDEWGDMVSAFRARILSLPSTAAVRVTGLPLREVEAELKDLIYQALEELSDGSGSGGREVPVRDTSRNVRPGRAAAKHHD